MTDPKKQEDRGPTPLEEILVRLIEDHGPIRVSDYMADVLGHPQHGYYMTQTAFGQDGDYITAPEINQVFGELIGAWLVQAWEDIGAPSFFNLIELGPGRGTLMADILRTAKKVKPKFLDAAGIYMVETSGRQRYQQQRKLHETGLDITWAADISDIPLAPTLIVANEFFDCMPIRQFVRTATQNESCWRERLVDVSRDDNNRPRLHFTLSKELHETPRGAPDFSKPEDIFEISDDARDVIEDIAGRFANHKGRALIIDYGHTRSGFGDTLQAMQAHHYWPVLSSPGEADVTAHVDFEALSREGLARGLEAHGTIEQGLFLGRLGIEQRARKLLENIIEIERPAFENGVRRLVEPDQMGTMFKVLCLSSPGLTTPAGFE
ncbi:class I SAM-dependent methyltransferase [Parvularcula flava]|uniref:ATP synthase subunit beta n=1 Tax=Aquisalinus luteolus TaxID=1566827 RepID=A0A8J3A3L2_9PROT|nr:SAM-dependent methyltransferase [Aquisalinus luteolus]NHK27745.1 class I SAM-dependent methyltransferase [Aquisalinus luteolus]GGH96369.1 ATP synthase subunit beta [Aquisalinus luteolus]